MIVPKIIKQETIIEVHNDLNKLRWVGSDEGWNLAIEAVQKHLKEKLEVSK